MNLKTSIISESANMPGRLNEDACCLHLEAERALAVVADGAAQRLPTTRTEMLFGEHLGGARFASYLTCAVAGDLWHQHPVDILLTANQTLNQRLSEVYGEVSATAFGQAEPELAEAFKDDDRLLRLALPACVATAVRVDMPAQALDFAHAGDTTLLIFYANGDIREPTVDQAGDHDNRALYVARTLQAEQNLPHFEDALPHENVQAANRKNGIYHNYVDSSGATKLELGIGVINGLPELADYLQHERLSLEGVAAILVCSDGFLWPSRWGESETEKAERYQHMRQQIEQTGLSAYVQALRAIETEDSTRDLYPRFKIHDDATAIYMEFSP